MEQSQELRYSFLTALSIMNSRYGLTIERDDFIELGYTIYKEIGNSMPMAKYYTEVVGENNEIPLQQISENSGIFVDSITLIPPNGYIYLQSKLNSGGENETILKSKKEDQSGEVTVRYGYTFGILLNYMIDSNTIKILDDIPNESRVLIKIYSNNLDADGLPTITLKESLAIAAGVAERHLTKLGFMGTLNNSQLQIFKLVKEDSDRLLQSAAIPEQISTSDMEHVLDAAYTMDRKFYRHKLL